MRLAEADPAVQKQRVVDGARTLGDLARGGVRERVALADDEVLEAVRAGLRASGSRRRRAHALAVLVHAQHELGSRTEQLLEHARDLGLQPRADLLEMHRARHLAVQAPLAYLHRMNRLHPATELRRRNSFLQTAQAMLPKVLRHRGPPARTRLSTRGDNDPRPAFSLACRRRPHRRPQNRRSLPLGPSLRGRGWDRSTVISVSASPNRVEDEPAVRSAARNRLQEFFSYAW